MDGGVAHHVQEAGTAPANEDQQQQQQFHEAASWSDLPLPALKSIGRSLDITSCLSARLVCSSWCDGVSSSIASLMLTPMLLATLGPEPLKRCLNRLAHLENIDLALADCAPTSTPRGYSAQHVQQLLELLAQHCKQKKLPALMAFLERLPTSALGPAVSAPAPPAVDGEGAAEDLAVNLPRLQQHMSRWQHQGFVQGLQALGPTLTSLRLADLNLISAAELSKLIKLEHLELNLERGIRINWRSIAQLPALSSLILAPPVSPSSSGLGPEHAQQVVPTLLSFSIPVKELLEGLVESPGGAGRLKQLLIQQTGTWDARAVELLPQFTGLEVLRLLPGHNRRDELRWNNLAPVSGLSKLQELQLVGYNPVHFSNGSATGEALSAALPDLRTLELLIETESDQVAAVAALTQLTRLKLMMQPRTADEHLPDMDGLFGGDAWAAGEGDEGAAFAPPQVFQDLQAAMAQVQGVLQQLQVPLQNLQAHQQNNGGAQAQQQQQQQQQAGHAAVQQINQQEAPQQAAAAAPATAAAAAGAGASAPASSSSSQVTGQQAQQRAPAGLGRSGGLARRRAAAASRGSRAVGTAPTSAASSAAGGSSAAAAGSSAAAPLGRATSSRFSRSRSSGGRAGSSAGNPVGRQLSSFALPDLPDLLFSSDEEGDGAVATAGAPAAVAELGNSSNSSQSALARPAHANQHDSSSSGGSDSITSEAVLSATGQVSNDDSSARSSSTSSRDMPPLTAGSDHGESCDSSGHCHGAETSELLDFDEEDGMEEGIPNLQDDHDLPELVDAAADAAAVGGLRTPRTDPVSSCSSSSSDSGDAEDHAAVPGPPQQVGQQQGAAAGAAAAAPVPAEGIPAAAAAGVGSAAPAAAAPPVMLWDAFGGQQAAAGGAANGPAAAAAAAAAAANEQYQQPEQPVPVLDPWGLPVGSLPEELACLHPLTELRQLQHLELLSPVVPLTDNALKPVIVGLEDRWQQQRQQQSLQEDPDSRSSKTEAAAGGHQQQRQLSPALPSLKSLTLSGAVHVGKRTYSAIRRALPELQELNLVHARPGAAPFDVFDAVGGDQPFGHLGGGGFHQLGGLGGLGPMVGGLGLGGAGGGGAAGAAAGGHGNVQMFGPFNVNIGGPGAGNAAAGGPAAAAAAPAAGAGAGAAGGGLQAALANMLQNALGQGQQQQQQQGGQPDQQQQQGQQQGNVFHFPVQVVMQVNNNPPMVLAGGPPQQQQQQAGAAAAGGAQAEQQQQGGQAAAAGAAGGPPNLGAIMQQLMQQLGGLQQAAGGAAGGAMAAPGQQQPGAAAAAAAAGGGAAAAGGVQGFPGVDVGINLLDIQVQHVPGGAAGVIGAGGGGAAAGGGGGDGGVPGLLQGLFGNNLGGPAGAAAAAAAAGQGQQQGQGQAGVAGNAAPAAAGGAGAANAPLGAGVGAGLGGLGGLAALFGGPAAAGPGAAAAGGGPAGVPAGAAAAAAAAAAAHGPAGGGAAGAGAAAGAAGAGFGGMFGGAGELHFWGAGGMPPPPPPPPHMRTTDPRDVIAPAKLSADELPPGLRRLQLVNVGLRSSKAALPCPQLLHLQMERCRAARAFRVPELSRCARLTTLQLVNVHLEEATLQHIAACCPLLQQLCLTDYNAYAASGPVRSVSRMMPLLFNHHHHQQQQQQAGGGAAGAAQAAGNQQPGGAAAVGQPFGIVSEVVTTISSHQQQESRPAVDWTPLASLRCLMQLSLKSSASHVLAAAQQLGQLRHSVKNLKLEAQGFKVAELQLLGQQVVRLPYLTWLALMLQYRPERRPVRPPQQRQGAAAAAGSSQASCAACGGTGAGMTGEQAASQLGVAAGSSGGADGAAAAGAAGGGTGAAANGVGPPPPGAGGGAAGAGWSGGAVGLAWEPAEQLARQLMQQLPGTALELKVLPHGWY